MARRQLKADRLGVASVILAVVALSLLVGGVTQLVQQRHPPGAIAQGARATSGGFLLLAMVTACVAIMVLLYALLRSARASRNAAVDAQRRTELLPGAFYRYRVEKDGAGVHEWLSDDAARLLGVSVEDAARDHTLAHRMIVEEDRQRLVEALATLSGESSPLMTEFRVREPEGTIRWIRMQALPERIGSSDIVWHGALTDITAIKAMEQALHEATRRLDDARSMLGFGDWTCDLASGTLAWSPQCYRFFERDPASGPPSLEQMIDLLQEGPQPMADAFEAAQATGEPQSFEATSVLPGGSVLALQMSVLPVSDDAGTVTEMRGTMHDITARRSREQTLGAAKDAADASNLAKSAFLATMSHEIRTPLSGMLGMLELIDRKPGEVETRTALDAVRESGRCLQRIIDDILDFSRVESGKLEIRLQPSRLAEVIDGVCRVHADSARDAGLDFRQEVDPGISPVLLLDALRLRQILVNLVGNAIKFTHHGSVQLRVTLVGRADGLERLRFEVVDTGIGIPPDQQGRLFQPFEQANDIASRFGGTGLGLSISRRLAQMMDGEISMTSAPGVGTTMTLDIAARATGLAPVPSQGAGHGDGASKHDERSGHLGDPPGKRQVAVPAGPPADPDVDPPATVRILVVDDHPTNLMVMRTQVNALGYPAEEAASGEKALELWGTGRFALVLTDCNMPTMSGHDLSRSIRSTEARIGATRTPIIACSANVLPGIVQECLDAGMDDYIAKPISLAVLAEKLSRWLPGAAARRRPPLRPCNNPPRMPMVMADSHCMRYRLPLRGMALRTSGPSRPVAARRGRSAFRSAHLTTSGRSTTWMQRSCSKRSNKATWPR